MIEQMKNENEYREDGNLYIKKVNSCVCYRKLEKVYYLECDIHQRKERFYNYRKGKDWIIKDEKKLWLADDAKETVLKAVSTFDDLLDNALNYGFTEIQINEASTTIYYKRYDGYFDCIVRYYNQVNEFCIEMFYKKTLEQLLISIHLLRWMKGSEITNSLLDPTKENIDKNPFYLAALEAGNLEEAIMIKFYYGIDDDEDCALLAKLTQRRILPFLPKEYDKDYCFDRDAITDEVRKLLSESNFKFYHKNSPFMINYSYKKVRINPHKKYFCDAAKEDAETITIEELFKMYDDYKKRI